jgi:hypothetical protein
MDMIDWVVGFLMGWIFWSYLKTHFTRKLINTDVIDTVMVEIDEVRDAANRITYLVNRADNKQFLVQASSLDEIMPKLRAAVAEKHIFLTTDNLTLLGLFVQHEEVK